ncbi:hypothetical protein [uncultured Senegalimassilia sp.]|uniref:hypothetical protein n=1 Tax=uncultured Senegalimassilia sp. TaxID=1714350 RepID=UPI00258D90BB|nr:hypothetical protein [uncultured Senegalimassilia sp.]
MSDSEGNKNDFQKPYIPWEESLNVYRFDLDQHGFPVFSDKNLRLVWAMVENDSDYNSVKPEIINSVFQRVLAGEEIAIKQAVYLTDSVNSTHLATLCKSDMATIKEKADQGDEVFKKVRKGWKVPDLVKDEDESSEDEDELLVEDDDEQNDDEDKNKPRLQNGRFMTERELFHNRDYLMCLIKAGKEQAVYEIAHYSEKYAKEYLGIEIKKNNFSFATKFCHYACVNGLDEEKTGHNRDLYCIYDSVVAQVLPYYIWAYTDKVVPGKCKKGQTQYRLLEKLLEDCRDDDGSAGYQQFRSYYDSVIKGIDAWREANGQKGLDVPEIRKEGAFSYRHVDRLIWYYFKGRRLDEAKERFAELIRW